MLQILNSQSRKKEVFQPLNPTGTVTFYTCGPTVYDSLHLGHARAAIVPDLVRRYLEFKGYPVRYVTNFTDVDDKIIKRAITEQRDWREITATYIEEFHRVMLALNVKPADMYPRATDHIPEMIAIVERLLQSGNAYTASDGDIYFDTSSYDRYGCLSQRKLEEEEAGLSGRIDQQRLAVKKNSGDFILWKLNKNDRDELAANPERVPGWNSPWGYGRPGWHLECSAMSQRYLGVPFDLHGGGMDLLFPHHEDEKAQTECAFCEELQQQESVRYWIHNAFITLSKEKMSKSLGNVKWLREMIWPEGPYDPMAVRMLMLSSHYRSPIDFYPELLDEASARLQRIYNALESIERLTATEVSPSVPSTHPLITIAERTEARFIESMDDDFNSAGALGAIFELINAANTELARTMPEREVREAFGQVRRTAIKLLCVLGIRPQRAQNGSADSEKGLLDALMNVRQEARKAKQFSLADLVRNELSNLGYEIRDVPGGKWEVLKK